METPHQTAAEPDEAGEALAREAALTARRSRNRIADRLQDEGEPTLAWLYRSTFV
ncbi:hypothetical protein [Nocardioides sp. Soil777]|uniref:hypothetical protein n=1 Tax=Nocardioides sp. Soil777 TaxID=1736409 RepID=UPI0012FB375C|nr:hypothetical protein [Nocardioides sp. Soil777]